MRHLDKICKWDMLGKSAWTIFLLMSVRIAFFKEVRLSPSTFYGVAYIITMLLQCSRTRPKVVV